MSQTIVLASNNPGKIREIQAMLGEAEFEVRSQREFQVPDADETGTTFIENAILKARHAARICGLPCIADDSGLEVDALNGQPGIYSARYAGLPSDDANNNAKLLGALEAVDEPHRSARFHCVMAFMRHADDPSPLIAHGQWEGRILYAEQGSNGFGYDPLFYVPEYECASAELDPAVKNRISHRGQALRLLLPQIQAWHQQS